MALGKDVPEGFVKQKRTKRNKDKEEEKVVSQRDQVAVIEPPQPSNPLHNASLRSKSQGSYGANTT